MSDKKLTLSFDPVTPDSFCEESRVGAFKIDGPEAAKTIAALLTATYSRNRLHTPEIALPALDSTMSTWINAHLTQEPGVPTSVHEVTGLLYAASLLEARACAIIGQADPAAALGVASTFALTRLKWAMVENGYDEETLGEAMDPWLWGPEAMIPILQNVDSQGCPCGKCGHTPHPDAPERDVVNPTDAMLDAMLGNLPPAQRAQAKAMLAKIRAAEQEEEGTQVGQFETDLTGAETPEAMAKSIADSLEREAGITLNAAQRKLITDDVVNNWEGIKTGKHVMAIKIPKDLQ